MTDESGRQIYAQAKAGRMKECYLGFHTLDAAMAIEDLKELHKQESGTKHGLLFALLKKESDSDKLLQIE